jgi:glutamate-1-semialdehyde 2,1-aminomutase
MKVFHSLLNQGIYLAPSAFEVSFLSTAHQPTHFEKLIEGMKKAILESGNE